MLFSTPASLPLNNQTNERTNKQHTLAVIVNQWSASTSSDLVICLSPTLLYCRRTAELCQVSAFLRFPTCPERKQHILMAFTDRQSLWIPFDPKVFVRRPFCDVWCCGRVGQSNCTLRPQWRSGRGNQWIYLSHIPIVTTIWV